MGSPSHICHPISQFFSPNFKYFTVARYWFNFRYAFLARFPTVHFCPKLVVALHFRLGCQRLYICRLILNTLPLSNVYEISSARLFYDYLLHSLFQNAEISNFSYCVFMPTYYWHRYCYFCVTKSQFWRDVYGGFW